MSESPAQPLRGRTVLVTRARERAAGIVDLLHERGARVVVVPLISTVPIATPDEIALAAQRLAAAPEPRWAAFTSAAAVRISVGAIGAERLHGVRLAGVGPGTAAALEHEGLAVELTPASVHSAAGLGEAMAERGMSGATVWLPCAEGAGDELPGRLRAAGARLLVSRVYRTEMPGDAPGRLRAALDAGVDAVTLTSGSSARHLAAALQGRPLPDTLLVACIGPQTAEQAAAAGLPVHAVASTHTAAGLADAVNTLLAAAQPLP